MNEDVFLFLKSNLISALEEVGVTLAITSILAGFRPWEELDDPSRYPHRMRPVSQILIFYSRLMTLLIWITLSAMIAYIGTKLTIFFVTSLCLLFLVILGFTTIAIIGFCYGIIINKNTFSEAHYDSESRRLPSLFDLKIKRKRPM